MTISSIVRKMSRMSSLSDIKKREVCFTFILLLEDSTISGIYVLKQEKEHEDKEGKSQEYYTGGIDNRG